jgi:monoterpene epsilon-lactone hydrolase
MTMTFDPNRVHWEAVARDEPADWAGLATEPVGVGYEWVEDPAGLWLQPAGAVSGSVLLAIHGGGFVSGSAGTHRRMFGHLARASGVRTFAVEYGLAPQHVFPSQLDTVTAAYRWLTARATAVAVTGDSCGAGLAVALAMRLRDLGLARPAALLLMSTWTDLDATGGSYDTGGDPFFTRDVVRALGRGYLAGADPRNPLAAPTHAEVHGLPATYLQVGAQESLLDDSRRLAARMRDAGVDVRLDEYPDQLHTFQMAAGRWPWPTPR